MYGPIFSRIIEYDKTQGTNDKGLQDLATIIVQVISCFSVGPKRSLETNI